MPLCTPTHHDESWHTCELSNDLTYDSDESCYNSATRLIKFIWIRRIDMSSHTYELNESCHIWLRSVMSHVWIGRIDISTPEIREQFRYKLLPFARVSPAVKVIRLCHTWIGWVALPNEVHESVSRMTLVSHVSCMNWMKCVTHKLDESRDLCVVSVMSRMKYMSHVTKAKIESCLKLSHVT